MEYEDIRDLINRNRLPGLTGKGVEEKEIVAAETQLSVRFSPSFRMFLKENGWGYFGHIELICGLGDDIPVEWRPGADLRLVVAAERLRNNDMPDSVVPFSQNGAGDWFALDCSRVVNGESPVIFLPHERIAQSTFQYEECSLDFCHWISERLS